MSRVLLQNVTKVFEGQKKAVDNITIDVSKREFMVIVGPSGCGKTTTLRLIAGLEDITSGTITIGDRIINDTSPKDRDIAMVFQNYALFPNITAFQNMAFGLKMSRCPSSEIRKRVIEAAELLHITHLLERKPAVLSGGERQRVAVGRAIVHKPKVFLFDEPLSNLDPKLRLSTRLELKILHQKLESTFIYVTHDQADAMALGDRVAVMHKGRIYQVGVPLEVYNRPINRLVAEFIGTPSMNFLDGTIVYDNDNVYFSMDGNMILLSSRLKKPLTNYKDNHVVFGIRPEHILLESVTNKSQNPIVCIVEEVEPLGDQTCLYLKGNCNQKLIAKVNPNNKVRVGHTVRLILDVDKFHIFKSDETGTRIDETM